MGGARETLVGRWWNGRWGRLARRDIWLHETTVWRVQRRRGDGDSDQVKEWQFTSERAAREFVDRLIDTGGDGWRDITTAVTK